MSHPIFIGIDLGTTNLKAAAFSGDGGAALAQAARRLPLRSEADGTREQDVPALRCALDDVMHELRAALGSGWAQVAGLGLAAQGGSGALVDGETGKAHTPMYLWNDSRARTHLAQVADAKSTEYWRELSQREGPAMGLARLAWLRDRQPEAFTPTRANHASLLRSRPPMSTCRASTPRVSTGVMAVTSPKSAAA